MRISLSGVQEKFRINGHIFRGSNSSIFILHPFSMQSTLKGKKLLEEEQN